MERLERSLACQVPKVSHTWSILLGECVLSQCPKFQPEDRGMALTVSLSSIVCPSGFFPKDPLETLGGVRTSTQPLLT